MKSLSSFLCQHPEDQKRFQVLDIYFLHIIEDDLYCHDLRNMIHFVRDEHKALMLIFIQDYVHPIYKTL